LTTVPINNINNNPNNNPSSIVVLSMLRNEIPDTFIGTLSYSD
jgi:hypothetical protein